GGITMSVWGGPRRRVNGVMAFVGLSGVVLLAAGLPPRGWLIGGAAFLFMFTLPMVNGCIPPLWQTQVAPDIHRRLFAARRAIATASLPLSMLVAGPLADGLFERWLAPGGALADSVGRFLGTGNGRGIGFLFMVLGTLTVLAVAIGTRSRKLMQVETLLP